MARQSGVSSGSCSPTASGYAGRLRRAVCPSGRTTRRISDMSCRFVVPTIVLAALMFSLPARAQDAPRTPFPAPDPGAAAVDRSQEKHIDGWYRDVPVQPKDQKVATFPRHALSSIWAPATGWRDGFQFLGANEYPSDAKPILPFTPLGENAFKAN